MFLKGKETKLITEIHGKLSGFWGMGNGKVQLDQFVKRKAYWY